MKTLQAVTKALTLQREVDFLVQKAMGIKHIDKLLSHAWLVTYHIVWVLS